MDDKFNNPAISNIRMRIGVIWICNFYAQSKI